MKKILLIQSRQEPGSIEAEQASYRNAFSGAAQLDPLSVLDEKLAWTTPNEILQGYGGVIFGGSGDFDINGGRMKSDPARLMAMIIFTRLRMFISDILAQDMPALAICFGHQLVAQMKGGDVEADPAQGKVGTHEVRLTPEGKKDKLFASLPESFLAQYAHRDSVTEQPVDAVLLASGSSCRFSALRYGENVYTMQFHPEITAANFIARLKAGNGYLPEGVAAESIVRESPDAMAIIPAWLSRVVV
jgi:GMP synthase-like glutamine amidotransferase